MIPVFKSRIGHFIVISLTLHTAILFVAPGNPSARNWLAAPFLVRLVRVPERTRQSHPTGTAQALPATETRTAPARDAAKVAQQPAPQRSPARLSTRASATLGKHKRTTVAPAPSQHQPAATAPRSNALQQQLIDNLQAALIPHFRYPLLARRRGWEGIVRIGVRIEANGSLTRLHLVEPSPYDVLNTAAINSLSRLARLPDAAGWLQGMHVDLVFPVEYRLLEG